MFSCNPWRLTSDGATRVQTPDGRFMIRTRPDGHVFEFPDVARRNFRGADGRINDTLTIKRAAGKRVCSVTGFSNAGDS